MFRVSASLSLSYQVCFFLKTFSRLCETLRLQVISNGMMTRERMREREREREREGEGERERGGKRERERGKECE